VRSIPLHAISLNLFPFDAILEGFLLGFSSKTTTVVELGVEVGVRAAIASLREESSPPVCLDSLIDGRPSKTFLNVMRESWGY